MLCSTNFHAQSSTPRELHLKNCEKMPRLTNEPPLPPPTGGIIDQQNGSAVQPQVTASSGGDVYIIPEYGSRTANQHHTLLVLPFVPHPSAAPPPHYFSAATPTYHDPPPEYESVSQSCSCATQMTNIVACGEDFSHHHGTTATTVSGGLQGVCDNGGCGLDHNEALAASYLYPELFATVTSRLPRRSRRSRPQSSVSTISTVSVSTVAENAEERPQYLTIKRWILVVLILMLLMTVSLLVGISLQHFQLLRKFLDTKAEYEGHQPESSTTTTTTTTSTATPEKTSTFDTLLNALVTAPSFVPKK